MMSETFPLHIGLHKNDSKTQTQRPTEVLFQ